MINVYKYKRLIAIILWTICCFLFLQFCFSYIFFYKEQMQMFLFSSEYLCSYFDHSAWLACLAGDFLTQFFYYIGAGALIVTLVLLLTWIVAYFVFKPLLKKRWSILISLLLVTYEAICNVSIHYPLSATLALLGSFALIYSVSKIESIYLFGSI